MVENVVIIYIQFIYSLYNKLNQEYQLIEHKYIYSNGEKREKKRLEAGILSGCPATFRTDEPATLVRLGLGATSETEGGYCLHSSELVRCRSGLLGLDTVRGLEGRT